MPRISELEACLLLSYFLFLKFVRSSSRSTCQVHDADRQSRSQKGQIADLVDNDLERTLNQIADVCERGLENAYGSGETTRAKWENVGKMCRVSWRSIDGVEGFRMLTSDFIEHDPAHQARHGTSFLDDRTQIAGRHHTSRCGTDCKCVNNRRNAHVNIEVYSHSSKPCSTASINVKAEASSYRPGLD
jgi:hypothetical protein